MLCLFLLCFPRPMGMFDIRFIGVRPLLHVLSCCRAHSLHAVKATAGVGRRSIATNTQLRYPRLPAGDEKDSSRPRRLPPLWCSAPFWCRVAAKV